MMEQIMFTIPPHNWQLALRLLMLLIFTSAVFSGCGKKDKTRITFRPNVAPLSFSFSRQESGLWSASAGVITSYGILSIEQEFDRREEFTYIVFRDRAKGTDQVFKVGSKGYVELHTIGEHKLKMQREENKIVVDNEAISGTVEVNIYPDSQAVVRVEFVNGPDFVLFTDRRLNVEYNSLIWSDDSLLLDTVQSVTYHKGLNYRRLVFDLKSDIKGQSTPLAVDLPTRGGNIEKDLQSLQSAFSQVAPNIRFERISHKGFAASLVVIETVCFLGMLFSIPLWRRNRRILNEARRKASLWSNITGKWSKGLEQERNRAELGFKWTLFLAAGLFIFGLWLLTDLEFVGEVFR
jgi:hypothetical protein